MKKFLKKVFFLDEKPFWPILTRIIEYGRPQIKICLSQQGIMTKFVQVTRSFPLHLGGCRKHKFLTKKTIFPAKKLFRPIFFSYYRL